MATYRMKETLVTAEEFAGPGRGTVKISPGVTLPIQQGDFLVKNAQGQLSVCAANMFHQMFEPVSEVFAPEEVLAPAEKLEYPADVGQVLPLTPAERATKGVGESER